MDEKIINLNEKTRKPSKEKDPISLGNLNLELLISPDGRMIYFEPSFSLDSDVDDELFEEFCKLLRKKFPDSIDKLLEIYKQTK